MTKQITVGYDGSSPSSEAVFCAAAEAKARAARLRIVSCFDYPIGADAVSGWVATEGYASLLDGSRRLIAGRKRHVDHIPRPPSGGRRLRRSGRECRCRRVV